MHDHDVEILLFGVLGAFLLLPLQRSLESYPIVFYPVMAIIWGPLIVFSLTIADLFDRIRAKLPACLRRKSSALHSASTAHTINWQTCLEIYFILLFAVGVLVFLAFAMIRLLTRT